jgi:uncharacterized protein (DUF433 family)
MLILLKTIAFLLINDYIYPMNRIITISPDIQSGTPVFYNTRVPVKNFFDYLKAGNSINDFLIDFPSVNRDDLMKLIQIIENTFTFNPTPNEKVTA